MSKPLVSIIMPTHNRATLVGKAIESVLSQTYENYEFLIINDASTDDTANVVKKYTTEDDRLIYIENEHNLYIAASLNKGIKRARGRYIARIDDDDLWQDPEKLRKQVEFLEGNKEYVVVGTFNVAINRSKGIKLIGIKPRTDKEIRDKMLLGCPFIHASVVMRKDALDKVGYYDEVIEEAEDYDLWMRLGKVGKLYNVDHPCVLSLVGGPTNAAHKNRVGFMRTNLLLIKRYKNDYPHYGLAYLKACPEYLDVVFPAMRTILWPIYKIRRIFLDNFGRKVRIEKL